MNKYLVPFLVLTLFPAWLSADNCTFTLDDTTIVHVTCHGEATGQIHVNITSNDGSGITYQWLNIPGGEPDNTSSAENLPAGTYELIVADTSGCSDTFSFTVHEPPPIVIVPNNVTVCSGSQVNLIQGVSGGTPNYSFTWTSTQGYACYGCNNTNVTVSQSQQFTVTVTDTLGCSVSENVTINVNPAIQVLAASQPETCGRDGKITVVASGGTAPYLYSLNGGAYQTPNQFKELERGQYLIQVLDSMGCKQNKVLAVADRNTNLGATVHETDVTCPQAQDGQIFISTNAGSATIYSIDSFLFQSFPVFQGLAGGEYDVFVEDTNGCVHSMGAEIFEPQGAELSVASEDLSCFGSQDGIVLVSTSGSDFPVVSYNLDGTIFQTDGIFTGLGAGTHIVTCEDSAGCLYTDTLTLSQPPEIVMDSATVTSISCEGDEDGEITVHVSGGTGGYRFSIDGFNFNTTGTFQNLAEGEYFVTIEDSSGCETIESVTVTQNPGIVINANISNATCYGMKDGEIIVITSGGAVVHDYSIDAQNWQFSNTFAGLYAGVYEVYVRDTQMCIYNATFFVQEPDPIDITGEVTVNGGLADIDVSVSGGNSGYSYAWSTGDTTEDVSGLTNGVYVVTVTDSLGCNDSAFFVVSGTSIPNLPDNDQVFIYPNPTPNELTVEILLTEEKEVEAVLMSLLGQHLMGVEAQTVQSGKISMDISTLSAAVYLLQLRIDDHIVVTKVMKQ